LYSNRIDIDLEIYEQVKLWYDIQSLQLVVTIVSAIELCPRKTGLPRNPYAKMFLLPDRRYVFVNKTKSAKQLGLHQIKTEFIFQLLVRKVKEEQKQSRIQMSRSGIKLLFIHH